MSLGKSSVGRKRRAPVGRRGVHEQSFSIIELTWENYIQKFVHFMKKVKISSSDVELHGRRRYMIGIDVGDSILTSEQIVSL